VGASWRAAPTRSEGARRQRVIVGTIVGATVVVAALCLWLLLWEQTTGQAIIADSPDGGLLESDVRDVTNLMLGVYADAIRLVTTAFGAITFLVGYQQKRSAVLSHRAWGLFSAGVIFLTGALIICLMSREILLTMVAQNAVDLTLPALLYGRWATYLCMTLAAVCVGFFATEAASAPEPASNGAS
jgi:hypothetical protein